MINVPKLFAKIMEFVTQRLENVYVLKDIQANFARLKLYLVVPKKIAQAMELAMKKQVIVVFNY